MGAVWFSSDTSTYRSVWVWCTVPSAEAGCIIWPSDSLKWPSRWPLPILLSELLASVRMGLLWYIWKRRLEDRTFVRCDSWRCVPLAVSSGWLIDWLIERPALCLSIDRSIDWLMDWFSDWLIDWFYRIGWTSSPKSFRKFLDIKSIPRVNCSCFFPSLCYARIFFRSTCPRRNSPIHPLSSPCRPVRSRALTFPACTTWPSRSAVSPRTASAWSWARPGAAPIKSSRSTWTPRRWRPWPVAISSRHYHGGKCWMCMRIWSLRRRLRPAFVPGCIVRSCRTRDGKGRWSGCCWIRVLGWIRVWIRRWAWWTGASKSSNIRWISHQL